MFGNFQKNITGGEKKIPSTQRLMKYVSQEYPPLPLPSPAVVWPHYVRARHRPPAFRRSGCRGRFGRRQRRYPEDSSHLSAFFIPLFGFWAEVRLLDPHPTRKGGFQQAAPCQPPGHFLILVKPNPLSDFLCIKFENLKMKHAVPKRNH